MAKITTLTFDLWLTLLLDNQEQGRARTLLRLEGAQKALNRFGECYDLEHIQRAYTACSRYCHSIREKNLDISFREQVEKFIDAISPGLAEKLPEEITQEVLTAYSDSFFVHPPRPHAFAKKVLADAKSRGLRIGLISNTAMTPGVAFRKFLEQHQLLDYFDVLTFSDEARLAKPSEEIFLMTLRELGADPAESIHIGDSVKNDVVGAKKAGMKALWIEGFSQPPEDFSPESIPDASISELRLVPSAIQRLAQGH